MVRPARLMNSCCDRVSTDGYCPERERCTPDEEIQLPTLVCVQCGYSWHPIRPRKPKRCSNHDCRSFCWDPTKYQKFCRKSAGLTQPANGGYLRTESRFPCK